MAERDIQGQFMLLQSFAHDLAGVDLSGSERENAQQLAAAVLTVLEILVCDIHRIADCAEQQLIMRQNELHR